MHPARAIICHQSGQPMRGLHAAQAQIYITLNQNVARCVESHEGSPCLS